VRDTSALRHYRAEVAGYGRPIGPKLPPKRLSRVSLARRRVTTLSRTIVAQIKAATVRGELERACGHSREGAWKWREHYLKDEVRDLVREARLAAGIEAEAGG